MSGSEIHDAVSHAFACWRCVLLWFVVVVVFNTVYTRVALSFGSWCVVVV